MKGVTSKAKRGPHNRTIGTNLGLSTADSCSLVLATSFAKECEYFDHCC